MVRWIGRSRASDARAGRAPTETPSGVRGVTRCRLIGGQIAESWTCWDRIRVLRQLTLLQPWHD